MFLSKDGGAIPAGQDVAKALVGWPRCPLCRRWMAIREMSQGPVWYCRLDEANPSESHVVVWYVDEWLARIAGALSNLLDDIPPPTLRPKAAMAMSEATL